MTNSLNFTKKNSKEGKTFELLGTCTHYGCRLSQARHLFVLCLIKLKHFGITRTASACRNHTLIVHFDPYLHIVLY